MKEEIDELYCLRWYRDYWIKQGFDNKTAIQKAKIDLNYQKSLKEMYELFCENK